MDIIGNELTTVFDAISATTGPEHSRVLVLEERANAALRRFAFFEAHDNGDGDMWRDLWRDSVDSVADLLDELGLTGRVSLYGVREEWHSFFAAQFAA